MAHAAADASARGRRGSAPALVLLAALVLGGLEERRVAAGQAIGLAMLEGPGGPLAAAQAAVRLINEDLAVLPNHTLVLLPHEPSAARVPLCPATSTSVRAIEEARRWPLERIVRCLCLGGTAVGCDGFSAQHRAVALLGPSFSSEAVLLGEFQREMGVFAVSFAATAAALSDKSAYDMFARTVPPDVWQSRSVLSAPACQCMAVWACTRAHTARGSLTRTHPAGPSPRFYATSERTQSNSSWARSRWSPALTFTALAWRPRWSLKWQWRGGASPSTP